MSGLEKKRREVRKRLIEGNEFPNIPESWRVERLRFLFTESKERNGKSPVGEMLSVSEYRGVVPREYEHDEQKRTDEELENYRVVRPGQLAVNSMWLNHLGLGVSEHTGYVSPAYNVYKISERLDRRFVHHLMRSNYYLKIYLRYLYGIRPNSFQIKPNDWASIPIIVPDLATQRQIADFLDRETARIDLLIEKKQRLVALLGEKLSSTISSAVTGGNLSGVSRFGAKSAGGGDCSVAAGGCGVMFWDESVRSSLRPLKHCCRVNPAVLPETTDPDFEFDYIDIGSVSLSEGITHKERLRFAASPSRARKPVREGDILVSTVRTYLRAISSIEPADMPQVASTGFAVLRASKGVDPSFLYRVVQSNPFVEQVVSKSTGVSYPAINPTTLSNIEVPVPDLATQRQIADFLDRETARIGNLSDKVKSSIELLKDYRSALITAAVTGQIDVQTYARSGATDRRLDAIQEEMNA